MVYSQQFVCVVVCNGQIVREIRDSGEDNVFIPFSQDYSLRFKNLHQTRAVVKVEIDGKNVSENGIIVEPNGTSELLGFLEGNVVKNSFRFIEKTEEVIKQKGDKIDDGFIRVTWQFEKQVIPVIVKEIEKIIIKEKEPYYPYPYNPQPYNPWYPGKPWHPWTTSDITYRGHNLDESIGGGGTYSSLGDLSHSPLRGMVMGDVIAKNREICENINKMKYGNQEGITVKGEDVNQNFRYVSVGELENEVHCIVIHLRGKQKDTNKVVKEPILVHKHIKCSSCGRHSKSSFKFCPNCSTRLI